MPSEVLGKPKMRTPAEWQGYVMDVISDMEPIDELDGWLCTECVYEGPCRIHVGDRLLTPVRRPVRSLTFDQPPSSQSSAWRS